MKEEGAARADNFDSRRNLAYNQQSLSNESMGTG